MHRKVETQNKHSNGGVAKRMSFRLQSLAPTTVEDHSGSDDDDESLQEHQTLVPGLVTIPSEGVDRMWNDVSFLLLQEPPEVAPSGVLNVMIDFLLRRVQPYPIFSHIEWFLPMKDAYRKTGTAHAATYIGEEFKWQVSDGFYDRLLGHWRAVPVPTRMLTPALEKACSSCSGAPYSIGRYLVTLPALHSIGSLLSDDATSPGHCATLVARTLKISMPNGESRPILPLSSSAYGPSTLYNAVVGWLHGRGGETLTKFEWYRAYESTKDSNNPTAAIASLSDSEIGQLKSENLAGGVVALIESVMQTYSGDNPEESARAERALGSVLVRLGKIWGDSVDRADLSPHPSPYSTVDTPPLTPYLI